MGLISIPRIIESFKMLTAIELQVARLISAGLSDNEIGERMKIDHAAVQHHISIIYNKIPLTGHKRVQLTVLMYKAGITDITEVEFYD